MKRIWPVLYGFYRFLGKAAYYGGLPLLYVYGKAAKRPRVRALIVYRGDVLLVRNWLGDQKWTLPGGGLLHGESEKEGLLREIKEELDVVLNEKKLHHLDTVLVTNNRAPYRISIYIESIETPHSITRNPREILEVQWFSLDTLPSDASHECMDAIERYGKGRNA